jgi:small subunit ribosomal protein S3
MSGAFKHLKYARVVNDIAFLIENDDSKNKVIQVLFTKVKLIQVLFSK